MEQIFLSSNIYVIKVKGKFIPYTIMDGKGGYPIRGYNKKGNRVWRSYKTLEEAKENLKISY